MNTAAPAPASRPPSTLKRDLVWLIALVLAFLLGYLVALLMRPPLTPPACPPPAATASPAGSGGAGGGAGGGGGSPAASGAPAQIGAKGSGDGSVVGAGGSINGSGAPATLNGGGSGNGEISGGGDFSASGKTISSGGDGNASGGAGENDLDGGGGGDGKLKLPPGQGSSAPVEANAPPVSGGGGVPPGGAGDDGIADDMPDMKLRPDTPGSRIVAARDFRYDRSGLPHYAGGVDKVASAMTIPPGGAVADGNATVAEIVTNDAPDAVAAWYRTQLPQDKWQMQAAPSAAEVDQNIAQTDKPAADFDQLAKDMEKTQQPGGGGQAAAMAILMKGMMAGQHSANGDAGIQGTPLDSMFGKIANMQLRGAQEGLNRMREAHLTMFQPTDRAHDPRMILILRDQKTGKTAVVIMKKATQA
ncbi:MAG: hypothetical protein QM741_16225 [Rudaea sp.]|uniref:hypothetical protein n=1 Tax=Rudaea sp. TaxID=2136325 RepID=UPI0039E61142